MNILRERRFWPLFWTQFLGAFNDNVFKNALVTIIAFKGIEALGLGSANLQFLCQGLFILPFFLFSAIAGDYSDRHNKSKVVRATKILEIIIMLGAAIAFYFEQYAALVFILFFMGVQSSFFGPAKYSIIPELVQQKRLTSANAYVEIGTFVSILLGIILGTTLASLDDFRVPIAIILMLVAASGYLTARQLPELNVQNTTPMPVKNPLTASFKIVSEVKKHDVLFNSIIAISWFWYLGAVIISIIPQFTKEFVGGSEFVVTYFMSLFTLGVAAGSYIFEKLSKHGNEIGLIAVGCLLLTIALLLMKIFAPEVPYTESNSLSLSEFLRQDYAPWFSSALLLFSLSGGLYTVPLYTILTQRSPSNMRSRTIACNNIMNALFMVVATGFLMLTVGSLEVNFSDLFMILAAMNLAVAIYVYYQIPEFTLRFISFLLSKVMYRLRVTGRELIPKEGAALLIANHISYVDWLIISAASPRPIKFVMDYSIFKTPGLNYLLRQADAIPIASKSKHPEIYEAAFEKVDKCLRNGELVFIFPEGMLTRDGNMNEFRPGMLKIVSRFPCKIVPLKLAGLWGSLFSFDNGGPITKLPRRFRHKIVVTIGSSIGTDSLPKGNEMPFLQEMVAKLDASA